MKPIRQLLHSYFHFQAAVLRSLAHNQLSKTEFTRITGLDGNTKYRRQTKPGLWKPAEIHRLAYELGLTDSLANRLVLLASLVTSLPPVEQALVYKACCLTAEKRQLRLQDATSWQPQELDKLKGLLEKSLAPKRSASYRHVSTGNLLP